DRTIHPEAETSVEAGEEGAGQAHAVSAELDESVEAQEVEPSDEMTAEGYDEAVERGVPYSAEQEIIAWDSADPVPLTEAEPITPDEIVLQEAGRDLRPDTITPSPDITSTGVAALDNINKFVDECAEENLASANATASAAGADE